MLHVAKLKHSRTELFGGWNNSQIIEEEESFQHYSWFWWSQELKQPQQMKDIM